jgi:hypothetical protein
MVFDYVQDVGLWTGMIMDEIKIEVAVSGGVASLVTKLPDNIRVYIRDYDIQDVDGDTKTDDNGDKYRLFEIF